MPRRIQTFVQNPWTGGLNTTLDETLINPGALTVADNVLFDDQGLKKTREGIDYAWDNVDLTVTARASTGTTRSLTIPGYEFVVGGQINIAGLPDYNASPATITAVTGDVIEYTGTGTLEESSTTVGPMPVVSLVNKIVGIHDYWFGQAGRTQKRVAINSGGQFAEYTNQGVRSAIEDAGTPYTSTINRASFLTFENQLIVAVDGTGNQMKIWDGTNDIEDVVNQTDFADPPEASILRSHLGRIWCNDKALPDRLHFSETARFDVWQGAGDSGALDIGEGDGDPEGITAIFPTFKGDLFVAKRTTLYRIRGFSPETFIIEQVSNGIGCISHEAVCAVDQDDIYFVSDRGVHSLNATDAYGSFTAAYKSVDVQKSINETWDRSQLKLSQARYLPEINSVAINLKESKDIKPEDIWLYNVPLNFWYRWPNLDVSASAVIQDGDRRRIYLGTSDGRIAKSFSQEPVDRNQLDQENPILFELSTGVIYPDGRSDTIKGFKKVGIIYRSRGSHTIQVNFKVDEFSEQPLIFTQNTASGLLDVDFILNQSVLGAGQITAPYMQSVDGFGRGFKLTIRKSDLNPEVTILGFIVEYEMAGDSQETRQGDTV